jgi:hypothetical protein
MSLLTERNKEWGNKGWLIGKQKRFEMNELLKRMGHLEPSRLPVISVYLDLRPRIIRNQTFVRPGLQVLWERLRELEETFIPGSQELLYFRADADNILNFLQEDLPTNAAGLALFASVGQGIFEVMESPVAFENHISAGLLPDLIPLARMINSARGVFSQPSNYHWNEIVMVERSGRFETESYPDRREPTPAGGMERKY